MHDRPVKSKHCVLDIWHNENWRFKAHPTLSSIWLTCRRTPVEPSKPELRIFLAAPLFSKFSKSSPINIWPPPTLKSATDMYKRKEAIAVHCEVTQEREDFVKESEIVTYEREMTSHLYCQHTHYQRTLALAFPRQARHPRRCYPNKQGHCLQSLHQIPILGQ